MRGASPPWAPSSVSLCSTASPWKGEAFLRGARRLGAPTSAPAEVIRRHEITHHVGRGLAPSTQSLPPSFASQMPPPSSEGGFFAGFTPPYTPGTPRLVGRFHTFIGNRAVLRPFPDTNRGPPPEGSGPLLSFLMPSLSASARWRRSRCSRGCSQPRRWGTRPSGPRSGRRTAAARPRAGPRSSHPPRGPACCSR